ncbi:MAG: GntR family transcriptional regulator [Paracoccus aminovorans]|nr:GntR family transcriptional regulator [Paracoccus aminovorans]
MDRAKSRTNGQATVTAAIRQAILSNDLVPGQRLIEADLCDSFSTSRSTVRAALAQLTSEGLVEVVAHRGARVRVIGLREALEIVDVRLSLELLCIERAIARMTPEASAELRELADRLRDRATANDVTGFAELTRRAFVYYVGLADHGVAREMLERLRDRLSRHRLRLTYRPGRPQIALPYWLDLIDALCRRDLPAARDALCRQVANIKETMVAIAEEETSARPALSR